MSVFKEHGEKFLLGGAVLLSAAFVYGMKDTDPEELTPLQGNLDKIQSAQKNGNVNEKYPYVKPPNPDRFHEGLAASLERPEKSGQPPALAANIAHIPPTRPVCIDDTPPPLAAGTEAAVLTKITEIKSEARLGKVFIGFKVPTEHKYIDAVAVQIFRGEAADKIDTSKPVGTFSLAAKPAVVEEKKPEEVKELTSGEKRKLRAEQAAKEAKEGKDPKGPKDTKGPVAQSEIPETFGQPYFEDTGVEPRKTYFYKVRLVGKSTQIGTIIDGKDAATGLPTKITIVKPVPAVATEIEGGQFATGFSEIVSATTGSNFSIALSTINGTLPLRGETDQTGKVGAGAQPGSFTSSELVGKTISNMSVQMVTGTADNRDFILPIASVDPATGQVKLAKAFPTAPAAGDEFKLLKNYTGSFDVKVWIPETKEWKIMKVAAGRGDPIKGKVSGKGFAEREFDTKYQVVKIETVEWVKKTEQEVTTFDDQGKKKTEKVVRELQMKSDVATVMDTATKTLEEYVKGGDKFQPQADKKADATPPSPTLAAEPKGKSK